MKQNHRTAWAQPRRAIVATAITIAAMLGIADAGHAQSQTQAPAAAGPQVMRVAGKRLLDSTGTPFLVRGIEGWFDDEAQARMQEFVDAIASQGFNAVRLQLYTEDKSVKSFNLSKADALIKAFHKKNMVVFLVAPFKPRETDWFGRDDVKALVEANKANLVIDATIEEGGDGASSADVETWLQDQKDAIDKFRGWGYTEPLTIGTLNSGRFLRAILDHGQELVDYDKPLHSLVLNAQMYWPHLTGNWTWQTDQNFTTGRCSGTDNCPQQDAGTKQALAEIGAKPFLIQIGVDAVDKEANGAPKVPYSLLMTEAQCNHIGTMFWQWIDLHGEQDQNSMVSSQFNVNSLTALGNDVINNHPAGIRKTSRLVGQGTGTAAPPLPPPAPAPSAVQTYSNDTDVKINDFTTVNSPITVSGRSGNAPRNASVSVHIVHTFIGDLKVDVVAPDGTLFNIHNRSGRGTDDISKTVSLDLSGQPLNGTWKLRVNDNGQDDVGFIDRWSITF